MFNGTKTVMQRWYYNDHTIPTGEGDQVLCDLGNNCRHYMHNQSRVKARELAHEGEKLKARGDLSGAEDAWRRATEAYPYECYSAAWLGETLYNRGAIQEAEVHFRNALVGAPFFPDVNYFMGEIANKKQQWDQAVQYFRTVTDVKPGDPDAWFMLGQALSHFPDKYGDAIVALKKQRSVNPGDNAAQQLLTELQAKVAA